jgi:hypothetical protein
MPPGSQARKDSAPFLIGWCIFLLLALGAGLTSSARGGFDFRSFYAAGCILRTQPSRLYDLALQQQVQTAAISKGDYPIPLLHPPYEALLYAPFTLLSYPRAYIAYLCFNMLLLLAVFFVARPMFSSTIQTWQPRPGLMIFTFYPVFAAIIQGQNSILLVLIVCLAWRELKAGRDLTAGLLLALGLFKFQIVLPLALLLAVRWGWRFAAGFAASSAAVAALSFALIGKAGVRGLARTIAAGSLAGDRSADMQRIMAIHPLAMPNLFGLVSALAGRWLSARSVFAIVALLSAATLLYTARLLRDATTSDRALALAVVCAILVSYHLYIHDLSLLLVPLALLVRIAWLRTAIYILAPLIVFGYGANGLFLLALPIAALLAYKPARTPDISETAGFVHA